MVFYNCQGHPIAYCEDGERIYLFSGKIVAYFYNDTIYGYNGHQFGWFVNGWIRDLNGKFVFFTNEASGGMSRPARYARPAKGAKSATPAKVARQAKHTRPAWCMSWSELSNEKFFMQ